MRIGVEGQIRSEGAILKHVMGHGKAEFLTYHIIIRTMGRRCVHKAGSSLVRYMIARKHGHIEIPFAILSVTS